jgi:hypothetical protein
MNKPTLAAFAATVLVAIPAGWRLLEADIPKDGAIAKPEQQTLALDGAKITVELDRGLMKAGRKVKVTLVATADTAKKVAVDVSAFENNYVGGGRVENPPTFISRRTITLDAAPGGGKPANVAFELGSGKKGMVQLFDVVVSSPTKKHLSGPDAAGDADKSARLSVATWTGDTFAMTIEPPAKISASEPFEVKVHVKNTTNRALKRLQVVLGEGPFSPEPFAPMVSLTDPAGFDIKLGERGGGYSESSDEEPIAAGAERVLTFTVTPKATRDEDRTRETHFQLIAEAHADRGGAMAVKEFDVPDEIASR